MVYAVPIRSSVRLKPRDQETCRLMTKALFVTDLQYTVQVENDAPVIVIETSTPGEVLAMLRDVTGPGGFERLGRPL